MEDMSMKKPRKLLGIIKRKSRNSANHRSSVSDELTLGTSAQLSDQTPTSPPQNLAQDKPAPENTPSSRIPKPPENRENNSLNLFKEVTGDTDRTRSKYSAARKLLKDAVESAGSRANWDGFSVPATENICDNISQLGEELEKILNSWKVSSENLGLWSSGKGMVRQIFIATSPFLKHLFLVGGSAAQVPVL